MKKILIVVDIQNGFITTPALVEIKNRIDALINLNAFDSIIATAYENYENSPIIRLMGWDKLLTKKEQMLTGEIEAKNDFVVTKKTYSALNDELLNALRKSNDGILPECVYIVGVDTECCVLATATDLFELGIRPIVLEKYCGASNGEKYHDAGILSLRSLIGKGNIFYDFVLSRGDLDSAYNNAINTQWSASNSTVPIENLVVDMLIKRSWHISFAESCTGGLACGRLVNVPNASRVLDASLVTYANEAKIAYLDASQLSIDEYGVVSEQVAREMAIGVAKRNNAEVGVGISGIAGPSGATPNKPVGMVCFGFYINGSTYTYTKYFGNIGRSNVRGASVDFVYETLLELLK